MSRAVVVLVSLLMVAGLAAPAGAGEPFGPASTVVTAGCDADAARGDTVIGADGITRGFVGFQGDGCTNRIRYFEGQGGSWSSSSTRYRGIVLAAAHDVNGMRLLYANGRGVFVARRTLADRNLRGVRVSRKGTTGAVFPSGDLVAAGGRWLAVWSEQVGPGGEFAQSELFAAQTLGRGHCFDDIRRRYRITRDDRDDYAPTLGMLPGGSAGKVRLYWQRSDGAQGLESDLLRGTLDLGGCTRDWHPRAFRRAGANNFAPDLQTVGNRQYLTWWRDDFVREVDGRLRPHREHRFRGQAFPESLISVSDATVFVAWTTAAATPRVVVAQREGTSWTRRLVTGPAAARSLFGLVSSAGTATVLLFDRASNRVLARSQM